MRRILKLEIIVIALTLAGNVMAGNPDRAGQAGATEILINPWAQSSGWYGLNVASIQGVESMNINVAGLSFINRTELNFSNTQYLVGTDISVNSFGLAQKVGEGAIGISIINFNLGDIPVTTATSPEGTGATFRPRLSNFAISYSRKFADYLSGGLTIRGISENISDVSAFGIALDVGIQYITGPVEHPEQIKMGVTLCNIGSPMSYEGDGLTFKGNVPEGNYTTTVAFEAEDFELPSLLTIGLSYDFYFGLSNRLTAVGTFISNSFSKDQFGLGVEYALKVKNTEMFMLRAGYRYEDGMFSSNEDDRTTTSTGLAAGVTFQTAFSKTSSNIFALSYSYRTSNPYDGTHAFGVRLSL